MILSFTQTTTTGYGRRIIVWVFSMRFSCRAIRFSYNIAYSMYSVVGVAVLLGVQHRTFRRLDFDVLLIVFVVMLVRAMSGCSNLSRWIMGLLATYVFCIVAYLAILGFNLYVFAYHPLGGFYDSAELLLLVPYLSMAPFYFVVQSAILLLQKPR